ncbi:hypothetical protein ACHAPF_000309 [Botrytis cinerea]
MGDAGPSTQETSQESTQGIPLARSTGLTLILDTPKGRGVFASQDIPARSVLEMVSSNWPYNPKSPNDGSNGTTKPPSTTQAVILGLGSMFNHSTLHQNVGWERDVQNLLITYTALRDIKKGEELCISYGSRLTFKDTEADALNEVEDENELLSRIELID